MISKNSRKQRRITAAARGAHGWSCCIGKGEEIKPKTAGRIARALGVDVTEIIEQEVV